MVISESTNISVDWSIEVVDVDVFVTTVIVLWQAVLIKTVIIKGQIISHADAFTSFDWVLDQRSSADLFTYSCIDTLTKFHVKDVTIFYVTIILRFYIFFAISVTTAIITTSITAFYKVKTVASSELLNGKVIVLIVVTVLKECWTDLISFIVVDVESDEFYET